MKLIKDKTQKLFQLKNEYNELVKIIDQELENKLSLLESDTIYLHLDFAKKCLESLIKNKSLLKSNISMLKSLLNEEIVTENEDFFEEEELISEKLNNNSDSFDLDNVSLDMKKFVNQFDNSVSSDF